MARAALVLLYSRACAISLFNPKNHIGYTGYKNWQKFHLRCKISGESMYVMNAVEIALVHPDNRRGELLL